MEPIGTRVMLSAPAAMTTSWVPDMTACAAKCSACWDEPHCRSIVTAGTLSGSLEAITRVASEGEGLLSCLADAAHDHILHGGRIDAGAIDQRVEDRRAEIGRMHAHQAALAARPPAVRTASTI